MKRPIPWHLILTMLNDGHPIESLAAKFGVPEIEIQKRASVQISGTGYVRSNLEVRNASNQIRSDLTTVLLRQSAELAQQSDYQPNDVAKLAKLIDAAKTLFAWPNAKPQESPSIESPQGAINLDLIKTTPEQMRDLAG
jgi:hypothetical protein